MISFSLQTATVAMESSKPSISSVNLSCHSILQQQHLFLCHRTTTLSSPLELNLGLVLLNHSYSVVLSVPFDPEATPRILLPTHNSSATHQHKTLHPGLPLLTVTPNHRAPDGEQEFVLTITALSLGDFREDSRIPVPCPSAQKEREIYVCVKARVMPRTKGTPSLRQGVSCVANYVELDSESDAQ